MDKFRPMFCAHCRQTYLTDATDECALCLKSGGLSDPRLRPAEPAVPPPAAAPRRFGHGPRPHLTVAAIFARDWPALASLMMFGLSAALLVVGWLFLPVKPSERDAFAFAGFFIALPLIAFVAAFCVGRVWRIHWVFRRGVVVPGRVVSTGTNSEDIAHAVVVYEIAGREYRITQVIGPVLGEVKVEDPTAEVVVDPARPDIAYLASMYLD